MNEEFKVKFPPPPKKKEKKIQSRNHKFFAHLLSLKRMNENRWLFAANPNSMAAKNNSWSFFFFVYLNFPRNVFNPSPTFVYVVTKRSSTRFLKENRIKTETANKTKIISKTE